MTIRTVLFWHIGVLFCIGAAAAGTYHGLRQLHAQNTAPAVQVAEASPPQSPPAVSSAPASAASPTVVADPAPPPALPGSASPPAKPRTAAALPPGFWFQPLPQQAGTDGHARPHVSHPGSHTTLASSHRLVRPATVVRRTVAVAVRGTLPPLPQPDPRVAYYGYPGYYPYAAGYRYVPYYPRYPYYSSY